MATNDFHDGLDVCVGNWGYYSEGILRDKWIHLPMEPDDIEPWLRDHGLVDEEHEEIYISDYDGLPFRCPGVFDEYPFGEIRDETVDAWRSRVAKGAVKKPAMPSEIAYAASAIAALSADGEDGGVHTAKL